MSMLGEAAETIGGTFAERTLQHHQFGSETPVMQGPLGGGYVPVDHPVLKALNKARNYDAFHKTAKGASGGMSSASIALHTANAVSGSTNSMTE